MVCPALLPPWLRTITSALLVSTSMILPFPSSPHCAPIRMVLAISIQRLGQKIFPTHPARHRTSPSVADKNAVGTCPRMIRTARLGASGFPRLGISQKETTAHRGGCVARVMRTILLIILIVLLLGALPTWPYSGGWGYYPSGGLGLILLILIILWLMGKL